MAHSHHTSAVLMLGGVALIAVIALGMWGNAGATGAAFALKHDAQCSRWQSACDAGKAKACRVFSRRCLDVKTSAEVDALARTMDLLKEELGRQALVDKKVLLDLDDIHALMSKYHSHPEYSTVKLSAIGDNQYNLEFTNQEGLFYRFPLMTSQRDGHLRWGTFKNDLHHDLRFIEDFGHFPLELGDYFIVSDINTSPLGNRSVISGPNGEPSLTRDHIDTVANTRVFRYESADLANRILTFTDLATGIKQLVYDDNNNSYLLVGGATYKVKVRPLSSTEANFTIDHDGDGIMGKGAAVIAAEGGVLILLANSALDYYQNQPSQNSPDAWATVSSPHIISTILQRDGFPHAINISIEERANNKIGLDLSIFHNLNTRRDPSNPFINRTMPVAGGLLPSGAIVEIYDPATEYAEEVTLRYPLLSY